MKRTNNKKRLFKLVLLVALMTLTVLGAMVSASAADLSWNLLTDAEAGYRVENRDNRWTEGVDENGAPQMTLSSSSQSGVLYIHDDQNILGSYLTFSLEGDFYFESFPEGLREGQYTPEERPLSFLCWNYKDVNTGNVVAFNAIRLDSEGYIHTHSNGTEKTDVKLELGQWYNIRCVFTPKNGLSEMFVNGKKVLDFYITRFDPNKYASHSVRYFDGYYTWGATMKNLIVKTNSDYTIEPKRESAADYLGYQTTKPENGAFNTRVVLGVNGQEFNRVGYEAIILTKDEDGVVQSDMMSLRAKEIYENVVDADGNVYNIKELYDYNYAAALEISELPLEPTGDYFELVVRPYVLGMDGIRRYGVAASFIYVGATDENGYPVMELQNGKRYSVQTTEDTFIYKGGADLEVKNNGGEKMLVVRNPGNETTGQFRAAYFRFTFTARELRALETATAAKLRIHIIQNESNQSRKQYDMILHGTGTDWTEEELNYNNHQTLAPTYEEIGSGPYEAGTWFTLDVLPYLQEQMMYNYSEDDTLTVSFRLMNEGHNDTCAVMISSKESTYIPSIEIETSLYYPVLNLSKSLNIGYEPWGYAEHLVNEWFDEIVDKVYPRDENGNLIYHEIETFDPEGYGATEPVGDFTEDITWRYGHRWSTDAKLGYKTENWESARFMRTLSTLGTSTAVSFLETDLAEMISEYDIYGGISNAGFTGEATGFFHTEKIGSRVYVIDPLGNPYFGLGINTVVLGDTQNHKDFSITSYGLEEVYFERITRELQETGINLVAVSTHEELLKVKDGLSVIVSVSTNGNYMRSIGRSQVSEGVFPFNNTINVFDPDFVKSANATVDQLFFENDYANNPHIFGYTSDNELPSGNDILVRYLTLDPKEEPNNGFSYAVAWTWLMRRTGMDCPTSLDDVYNLENLEELNDEFLGFVYGRYYRVTREAIERYDTNHMYIGSRINGTLYDSEGYHRNAGYYLDIMTANLYGGLNPIGERMTNMYRNSGIPFLVTEFFAKGIDTIDSNGYPMANSTGAGILVQTQQERADYYEHYSLAMLESQACIGWIWYRFRDNDQGIYTSDGTNRLIMLHMTYGVGAKANTFLDTATGKIVTAAEVGTGLPTTVYKGEGLASNQNVNKGLYNGNFSSTVAIYEYDANGKLISSSAYEVEHPESRDLPDGTVLTASDGSGTSFTLGRVDKADGYTETVLTTYKGQYVAFAKAIKNVSDHLIGLINYFDGE